MTDEEQKTIVFLLSMDKKELAQWHEQASEEEVAHAAEILDYYARQLMQDLFSNPKENYGINFVQPSNNTIQ